MGEESGMVPESPASDGDGTDASAAPTTTSDASGDADTRRGKTTLPLRASGKPPLPGPWRQPEEPQPSLAEDDIPLVPVVTPEHWLPKPQYWLADHQRIPRPPTRPIPRPTRFRRGSRVRSCLLLLVILACVGLFGAGIVMAGRLSYQYFNAPTPVPTAHPANFNPASLAIPR